MIEDLFKSYGLPETIDPTHQYIYKTGEHELYRYWYRDMLGNYWEYTNAPKGHPDFFEFGGEAILVAEQPMYHSSPQFFTEEGYKLNIGIPDGVESQRNENYDPTNHSSIWFSVYKSKQGLIRFVYLDSDVRENLDLWVQQQLRIVDAGISAYRKYASDLFVSGNEKDKVIGTVLMLLDQGLYGLEELIFAAYEDLEFIDNTVKLLGRKFVCDPDMLDYLTMLKSEVEPGGPLFYTETMRGKEPLGMRHISAILMGLKMSDTFLKHWHANHLFSRIVHRLSLQQVPPEEVEELALNELSRVFATPEDISFLIDYKLRDTLISNYEIQDVEQIKEEMDTEEQGDTEEADVQKSLSHVSSDDFGVNQVWSDLTTKRADEREFSSWLQNEPLHEVSPKEEELVQEAQEMAAQEMAAQEDEPEEEEE